MATVTVPECFLAREAGSCTLEVMAPCDTFKDAMTRYDLADCGAVFTHNIVGRLPKVGDQLGWILGKDSAGSDAKAYVR
jgi:hypothetical protein